MKSAEQKAIEQLEEIEEQGFFLGYCYHINGDKMVPTDFEMEFLRNHQSIARIAMWLNNQGSRILHFMGEWLPLWYLYLIWPGMKRRHEALDAYLKEIENELK